MILRKAAMSDLDALCALYADVCSSMEAEGLHQWHFGTYPSRQTLTEDIERGELYCADGAEGPAMAVTVSERGMDCFEQVNWLFGRHPGYFYRVCVHPGMQDQGYGTKVLEEAEDMLRDRGCDCVRCDVYQDNTLALRLFDRRGMRTSGRLVLRGRPRESLCLEKPLTSDCALLPLRMHPAFRGGSLTPWGGSKLMSVYQKPIVDIPTGESLEASCVKDLNSRDDAGVELGELVKKYGAPFAGKYAERPFPLLLKLIDAREQLSVQVHPDDAYAGEHEQGKLGKTEAWLILDAPEGSQLVYGIRENVTLDELREACRQGKAVEKLLRYVDVRPGDVCYIPAGCVHAIGAGIMLYEIQQSSDITYRFYDWDRVDRTGKRRELHLDKALDVTRLDLRLDPVPAPEAELVRVLDKTYFTLDLIRSRERVELPEITDFGFLTCLEGDIRLCWDGASLPVKKGETFYVPCAAPHLWVEGEGRAALAMPR